jgi:hypothetical protein
MNGIIPPFHPMSSWLSQGIYACALTMKQLGGGAHKRRSSLRFMTYLSMVHPTIGRTAYNKLEITPKKWVVFWSRYYSVTILKRLRKAGKNLSQDILCPCRESKKLFPDYKPEMLRLEPPWTLDVTILNISETVNCYVDFVQTNIRHKAQLNTTRKFYNSVTLT